MAGYMCGGGGSNDGKSAPPATQTPPELQVTVTWAKEYADILQTQYGNLNSAINFAIEQGRMKVMFNTTIEYDARVIKAVKTRRPHWQVDVCKVRIGPLRLNYRHQDPTTDSTGCLEFGEYQWLVHIRFNKMYPTALPPIERDDVFANLFQGDVGEAYETWQRELLMGQRDDRSGLSLPKFDL